MRYTVDLAGLGRAIDHVARALFARRGGAARQLDRVASALPHGQTTRLLPELAARWRVRERQVEDGLAGHAEGLRAAAQGYARAEVEASSALDDLR